MEQHHRNIDESLLERHRILRLLERLKQDGLLTPAAGKRLRNELFAPGNRRPPEESIRAYLDRDFSILPFQKSLMLGGV